MKITHTPSLQYRKQVWKNLLNVMFQHLVMSRFCCELIPCACIKVEESLQLHLCVQINTMYCALVIYDDSWVLTLTWQIDMCIVISISHTPNLVKALCKIPSVKSFTLHIVQNKHIVHCIECLGHVIQCC